MPPTFTDEGARAARGDQATRTPRSACSCSPSTSRPPTPSSSSALGGFGYLLKDRVLDVGEFLDAAERVARGGSALDPKVVAPPRSARGDRAARSRELTEREREVLALMAEGLTNAGIAKRLVPQRAHGRGSRAPRADEARHRPRARTATAACSRSSPTSALRRRTRGAGRAPARRSRGSARARGRRARAAAVGELEAASSGRRRATRLRVGGEVRRDQQPLAGLLAAEAEDVVVAGPERLGRRPGRGSRAWRGARRSAAAGPPTGGPRPSPGRGGARPPPSPSPGGASSGCRRAWCGSSR